MFRRPIAGCVPAILLITTPALGQEVQRSGEHPPVAIVGGIQVTSDSMRSGLLEAAGGLVLEEVALDFLVRESLRRDGLIVGDDDIAAERRILHESLASEAAATPEQAEALLLETCRSRGLGPVRLEALLRRSAGLRKLVGQIMPSADDVDRALRLEFGPRARVRMLTVADPAAAGAIRERLRSSEGKPELPLAFAAEAATHSTDSRASAGGLVPSASAEDPSFPGVIRSAIAEQVAGRVSDVLAVDRGYALVLVESRTPGRDATPAERAAVETKVRRRQERLAMEAKARDLLAAARPIVLDASLRWSWENPPR